MATKTKKKPGTAVTKTIDSYMEGFPPEIRSRLEQMRETIGSAAPGAEEAMSYQIPTWKIGGNLVHCAAYGQHIGFYPGPSAITAFAEELSSYKQAKGSVQFPHSQPLPLALIRRIVNYRVKEASAKIRTQAGTRKRAAKSSAGRMAKKAKKAEKAENKTDVNTVEKTTKKSSKKSTKTTAKTIATTTAKLVASKVARKTVR